MKPTKYVIIKRDDLRAYTNYLEYEMIEAKLKREDETKKAHNVWKDSPRGVSIVYIRCKQRLHYKLKNIWLRCELSYRDKLREMERIETKKFFGLF